MCFGKIPIKYVFKSQRILDGEEKKSMEKRSMPVCFTEEQYKKIEEIAKKNGMFNASQAIEKLLDEE